MVGSLAPVAPSERRRTKRRCACGQPSEQEWCVTAPHTVRPPNGGPREPWGVVHVRRDGEMRTACGMSTIGWTVLWEREFTIHGAGQCVDCLAVLMGHRACTSQEP